MKQLHHFKRFVHLFFGIVCVARLTCGSQLPDQTFNKFHPLERKSAYSPFTNSTSQSNNYQQLNEGEVIVALYKGIEFGAFGAESLEIILQNTDEFKSSHNEIEFRVDTSNGEPFARAKFEPRATNFSIPITKAIDGTHDLYLTAPRNVHTNMEFYFNENNPRPDVSYAIMSLMHGKVLTTERRFAGNGIKIRMRTFKNETDQLFNIVPLDNSPTTYKILVKDTGRALTIPNNILGLEPVVISDYFGTRNQQWIVNKNHNDNFVISARHSGKCLEVQHSDESDNVLLNQNTCSQHKDNNQEWLLMNHVC